MKKLLVLSLLAVSAFGTAAQAATADLSTFSTSTGTNSSESVTANLAVLFGTASITASVVGLASFDWNFTAGDRYVALLDDYSYFTVSSGTTRLSDIGSVGSFGTTGWETFHFTTPYTGTITIGVANAFDDEDGSTLAVRNLLVSAVPEPDSYALMLAGLGVVGSIAARRRIRHRATT